MLAKQLDDALSSGGTGDWRARGGKCASCQAPGGTARTSSSRPNGSGGTDSQPMSLLAELEQAEAANSRPASAEDVAKTPQLVDVDLTTDRSGDPEDSGRSEADPERWATQLCDVIDRRRRADPGGSRSLELSADTRYRLLKLIGSSGGMLDDGGVVTGGKQASTIDLAEQIRNRDARVAELTCEVRA